MNRYYKHCLALTIVLFFFITGIKAQDKRWDNQFIAASAPNDTVYAILIQGNNIYIGGSFTTVAGIPANHVAMWNGSTWQALGTGTNNTVYALALHAGSIYAGGSFTQAGSATTQGIARWDGTSWSGSGTGAKGTVRALYSTGGELYLGGTFIQINGLPAANLAVWDGTSWSEALGGTNGFVYALSGDGVNLYAGGIFTQAGGVACNRIAKHNGTSWLSMSTGMNDTVYSIYNNAGTILAGGSFTQAGTIPGVARLGKWTGTDWQSLAAAPNNSVYAIGSIGSKTVIGGRFSQIGSVSANSAASFDGTSWSGLGSGTNMPVYSLSSSTYDIYAGGTFTMAGGKNSNKFGRYGSGCTFISTPAAVEVCYGNSVNLTVMVAGSSAMNYQWSKEGLPISGANSATLSYSPAYPSNSGNYTCMAWNFIDTIYTGEIQVLVHNIPTGSFTGLAASYCQNSAVSGLSGIPTGGSFSGSGISGTTFNPALSTVGSVSVTYSFTDVYGCPGTASQSTSVLATPVLGLSGLDADYCISSAPVSVSVSPTGGTLSGPGISGNTFTPSTAGAGIHTLQYIYSAGNGCSDTLFSTVTVYNDPPAAVILNLESSYCLGESPVNMTGWPSGGVFSGSGVSGQVFNPNSAGVGNHTIGYIFTDANGCTSSTSLQTSVYSNPVVNIINSPATYCGNHAPISLSANISGGTWTGQGTGASLFYPEACLPGNIPVYYTYTDLNGCSDKDTVVFTILATADITLSGYSALYCITGSTDTIDATPAGGTFSGNGMTNNIFSPGNAGAGIHEVIYTYDNLNGCYSKDTIDLEVIAIPVISAGADKDICLGSSVLITTSGTPGSYAWSSGQTGPAINVAPIINTTYYVTVTIGTCTNSDTVTVFVHPGPALNLGNDTNLCRGTVFDPGSGYASYNWSLGQTTQTITVLYPGNYELTVTDSYGCSSSDNIQFTILPTPTVNLGSDMTITWTQIITLTVSGTADHFLWSDGTDSTAIIIDGMVLGPGTHTIWVNAINDNGCSDSDSILITVLDPTFTADNSSGIMKAYPNPFTEQIMVEFPAGIVCKRALLYNSNGIKIRVQKNILSGNSIEIPANLSPGLYFLILESDQDRYVFRLVRQ